jgi:hypothetical protein
MALTPQRVSIALERRVSPPQPAGGVVLAAPEQTNDAALTALLFG